VITYGEGSKQIDDEQNGAQKNDEHQGKTTFQNRAAKKCTSPNNDKVQVRIGVGKRMVGNG